MEIFAKMLNFVLGDIDYYAAKAQFSSIREEFNSTNFKYSSNQDLLDLGLKESYLPYIRL